MPVVSGAAGGEFDEEAGEMAVVLLCTRCPSREVLPIR